MSEWERCLPPDEAAFATRMSSTRREQLSSTSPLAAVDASAQARRCALEVGRYVDASNDEGCAIGLTATERAVVAAQRRRRTGVQLEGTASDLQIQRRLVDYRDRVCACADHACVAALDDELADLGGKLEGGAAVEAHVELLFEEISECRISADTGRRAPTAAPAGPVLATRPPAPPRALPAADAAVPAVAPPPVIDTIRLPDGESLTRTDCAKRYPLDATDCADFFESVGQCHADFGDDPTTLAACVDSEVESFLEWVEDEAEDE